MPAIRCIYVPDSRNGMSGRNPAMDAALTAQELERFQFVKNLRNQTPSYLEYVEGRVSEISEEVAARKQAAFQKAQTDLGRYMDMEHNANYYKIRSGDVDRLTKVMEENNNKFAQSRAFDKDITKRQFEINEWYNYNKLETLFFLQVFFIVILAAAIVIYLQKTALITSTMAGLVLGVLVIGVTILGVYRYSYTRVTRDPRLWHRRDFGRADKPAPAARCDPKGNVVFDVAKILPEGASDITKCASNASAKFSKWLTEKEDEMVQYDADNSPPGTTLLGKGGLCTV